MRRFIDLPVVKLKTRFRAQMHSKVNTFRFTVGSNANIRAPLTWAESSVSKDQSRLRPKQKITELLAILSGGPT